MNLYLDTEFDSFGGPLISIAMVSECGSEFYEVLPYVTPCKDPWVDINVIPILQKEPISIELLREKLLVYLKQFVWKEIVIIADWPDDISYFCGLLITGPGKAIRYADLNFKLIRCDYVSEVPHNALYDARAIREVELTKGKKKCLRS